MGWLGWTASFLKWQSLCRLLSGSTLALFAWAVIKIIRIGHRDSGLPPGPPTVLLLEKFNVFPVENVHCSLNGLRRNLLGINMDGWSSYTLDRPPHYMGSVVAGGSSMVLAGNSEVWRVLRKAAQTMLATQASLEYLPTQKAEAAQAFFTHIRRYSNSVILSVLYGKRCPRYESPEAKAFFTVNHLWNHTLEPGAHPPLDLLPFLRYLPGSWKVLCKQVRRLQRQMYFDLLDECQARLQHGQETGFFIERVLQNQKFFGVDSEMTEYLGGALIEGGDHQRVAPLAIPHAMTATEECNYHGYTIPKGATIFDNTCQTRSKNPRFLIPTDIY
ncbi:cytochrome P450 [Armillaria borealis]|uniref:Cytochrome P450 n=1 Tax=Armillaria borealis TaxID=47425 RepID=A0AA39JYF4_9AGAR|nr:cytochrome P450 [Armillaria borealis]